MKVPPFKSCSNFPIFSPIRRRHASREHKRQYQEGWIKMGLSQCHCSRLTKEETRRSHFLACFPCRWWQKSQMVHWWRWKPGFQPSFSPENLSERLTTKNCTEMLVLAGIHNCVHLKRSALHFILLNRGMKSDWWKNLKRSHPALAIDVFDHFEVHH